jgi:hypothetical protein
MKTVGRIASLGPLYWIVFVAVALNSAAYFGCRKQTPPSSSPGSPTSKQTSASMDLARQWEQERAKLNQLSKGYPAEQLRVLESLIEKLPPEQVAGEFERIRSTTVGFRQMSEFDQNLLGVFVIRIVKQRDRDKLVYLLAGQCPRFIATDGIELYLAFSGMPDPLLILFDSYAQAKNEPAQSEIIEALGSVFKELRRQHANDREFVDASKQWYLENKSRLRVNPTYHPGSDFAESRDFFVTTPL